MCAIQVYNTIFYFIFFWWWVWLLRLIIREGLLSVCWFIIARKLLLEMYSLERYVVFYGQSDRFCYILIFLISDEKTDLVE